MKRYPIRAMKFALKFFVIIAVLLTILDRTGYGTVSLTDPAYRNKWLMMGVAFLILMLLNPIMGYVNKRLEVNFEEREAEVDKVMEMCGFRKVRSGDGVAVYQVKSTLGRIFRVYEDSVTITTIDGVSMVEGPRKDVVKIQFRVGTYVRTDN